MVQTQTPWCTVRRPSTVLFLFILLLDDFVLFLPGRRTNVQTINNQFFDFWQDFVIYLYACSDHKSRRLSAITTNLIMKTQIPPSYHMEDNDTTGPTEEGPNVKAQSENSSKLDVRQMSEKIRFLMKDEQKKELSVRGQVELEEEHKTRSSPSHSVAVTAAPAAAPKQQSAPKHGPPPPAGGGGGSDGS